MNKNMKMFLFATLVVLFVSLSVITAADVTDNATSLSNDIQTDAHTDNSIINVDKNTKEITKTQDTSKLSESKTYVVNNDSVTNIFSGTNENGTKIYTLNDSINAGDILDFQGLITTDNHSLVINKPVNITSSTHNANISLNTTAGSYFGDDPGTCFVINKGASGSNITNLYLFNTELWVYNTYDVYLGNMTMHVENQRVGSGVGQTALRYSERITMESCTIYTENNGGSSSFVLTGCRDITLKDTTIQGVGNVGNLVFLGNGFNTNDKPTDYIINNTNYTVDNCTIIGQGSAISIPIQNTANFCTIVNNTVLHTGTIGGGANATVAGNKMYYTSGISTGAGSDAYGNVFYGTGTLTALANSKVHNNTLNNVSISAAGVLFENNTVANRLTVTQPATIKNNNLNIIQLTAANAKNTNITNNNITGFINATVVNLTIENNNITTTNEYAIYTTGASGVTIKNNIVASATKAGVDAVYTTQTTTEIESNTPEPGSTFEITDETYSNFFNANGLLTNTSVTNYSTINLNGVFNKKLFVFDNIKLTILGNDAVINNGSVSTKNNATIVLDGVAINNADDSISSSIVLESDNNILRNISISRYSTTNETTHAEINVTGNGNSIINSNFDLSIPSNDSTYYNDGILISSSNNIVRNNTFKVEATTNSTGGYGTINVIYLTSDSACNNNLITNNTINGTSYEYLYGIYIGSNTTSNQITLNKINISAGKAYGIQIGYVPSDNNTISSNTLYLTGVDQAYGISISNWGGITSGHVINSNAMSLTASEVYGIELGTRETANITSVTINSNNINASGNYTMGIGISGTNITMNLNTLRIDGTTNGTKFSYDIIRPTTVGILVQNSKLINLGNNSMNVTGGPNYIINGTESVFMGSALSTLTRYINSDNDNIIIQNSSNVTVFNQRAFTTNKYSIVLINSSNNNITSNILNASNTLGGNDAISIDSDSTYNVLENNTPTFGVLTNETYSTLFENGVYNNKYAYLTLASDLYGVDLIFTNGTTFSNSGNYTLYNSTIILSGNTETITNNTLTIMGINFNNTNKPVFINNYTVTATSSNQRNVYFNKTNIYATGDDLILFSSNKTDSYVYLDVSNSIITATGTNVTIIDFYGNDTKKPAYISYTTINVTATNKAYVLYGVNATLSLNYNNITQNAPIAVTVNAIDSSMSYNTYLNNTITGSGDLIMALNQTKADSYSDYIRYNNITFTSTNPIVVFNIVGATNIYIEYNNIIANCTSQTTPIINLTSGNNYVRYNNITSNDLTGFAAINASGATRTSNAPTMNSNATINVNDIPDYVLTNNTLVLNISVVDQYGAVIRGTISVLFDGEVVNSTTGSSLNFEYLVTTPKTTNVTIRFVNSSYYNTAEITKFVDFTKKNTTVTVSEINATAGDKVTVNVTIVDTNGENVTNGTVTITVNNQTIKDSEGNVIEFNVTNGTVNYDLDLKPSHGGNGTIIANYSGDDIYKEATGENTTKIEVVTVNYYVSDSTGSDDNAGSESAPFKTIGKAIESMNSSSTIYNVYILEGTYKGVGNTNLTVNGDYTVNFIGKGIGSTIIDGEANFTIGNESSVWGGSAFWNTWFNTSGNWFMNITSGNGLISMQDFTIQNCWSNSGSSIAACPTATIDNHATLNVSGLYIHRNHAGNGAGIRNWNGATLYVDNTVFENNTKSSTTGNYGAAVYNNGTAIMTNSVIRYNYARWGSVTNDKNITLINCTFEGNIPYDGGSGYKNGPAFAADTGITNYFGMYAVYNITSTIINCTFLDNGQCDISSGNGALLVDNCIFNHSTGIYLFPNNRNTNLTASHQIIRNSQFIDMQPSTVFATLISSTTPSVAVRSVANNNLTIENNIIDVEDTVYGYGLYIQGNTLVRNNTLNNYIYVTGQNDTIVNNTINTTKDATVTGTTAIRNLVIENNTLYSSTLVGDLSVSIPATALSYATINGNLPEATTQIITDENYTLFFDENGIFKSDVIINGSKIFLSGKFIDRDFIFDNVKLYIQGVNATLLNSTITIRNNAVITLDNVTVNNTKNDKGYILLINSTDNTIKNSKFLAVTDKALHGIKIEEDNTLVTNVTVNITVPLLDADYDYTTWIGTVQGVGIFIRSSNNRINNSIVNVTGAGEASSQATIDGIDIQSKSASETVVGNEIRNTKINVTGGVYTNALYISRANNTHTNMSYFNSTSNWAYGIQIAGPTYNSTLSGYVYVNGEAAAYGVYMGMGSQTIVNTNLSKLYLQNITAPLAYGFSAEGVIGLEISNATYKLYGNTIYVIDITPSAIYDENWAIVGLLPSKDIFINGIGVVLDPNSNLSSIISITTTENVLINLSSLNTTKGNAIVLSNVTNATVTNNYINVNNLLGGDSAIITDLSGQLTTNNNTPIIALLSDETYSTFFDENGILKTGIDIITLGGDLHDKQMNINNLSVPLTFANSRNYTAYNSTLQFNGETLMSNSGTVRITGWNFNNTNKSAIIYNLTGTYSNSMYINYTNFYIYGDNVVAVDFSNNAHGYTDISYSNFVLDGENLTAIKYSSTSSASPSLYVTYSNITMVDKGTAVAIDTNKATLRLQNNTLNIAAENVIVINANNTSLSYSNMQDNNITASGTNLVVINLTKKDTGTYYIQNNTMNLTSANPIIAINIPNAASMYIQYNDITVNANNGLTPVINLSAGRNNYVRNNYIKTNDISGFAAINASGATRTNNTPEGTLNVTVTINSDIPTSIPIKDTLTINASAVDVYGANASGTFNLIIDGVVVATKTGSNVTIEYVVDVTGTKDVILQFVNGTYYNEFNITSTIEFIIRNVTVEISDITGYINSTVSLNATVVDVYGENVTSGTVKFTIGDEDIAEVEVVNGSAEYSLKLNDTVVSDNIVATYTGDKYYNNASATANFTVVKPNVTIKVLTDGLNVRAGKTINLVALITYEGKLVKSGIVTFKFNSVTLKDDEGFYIQVNVTNGIARATYTIPVGYSAMDYTLNVVYGDNAQYNRTEANGTVTIVKTTTYIKLDTVDVANGTLKVVAGLYDIGTTEVVNETLVDAIIKINGVTQENITAQFIDGVLNITLPLGDYEVSNITICSNYTDSYYESRIDFVVYNDDESSSKLSSNNIISDVKTLTSKEE